MRQFRIVIPAAFISHLNATVIEHLVRIAIRKEVVECDIEYLYTSVYPTRRRAVRALINQINDNAINQFNIATVGIREKHKPYDRYNFIVCSTRESVFVTKY